MKWPNMWKLKNWHLYEYDKGIVKLQNNTSYLRRKVKLPELVKELMENEYIRGSNDRLFVIQKELGIKK